MKKNSQCSKSVLLPRMSSGDKTDASSEMIGSIILIGVFVAAFGIILVLLLSAPSEFQVPAVVIEAGIIEDDDTYVLDLLAGDTLQRNETRILVDGRDMTANFTSETGDFDWIQWGTGDSLYLDLAGDEVPDAVQVIYYSPEGNGILLWDVGTSVTVIPPTGLTPQAAFSANTTLGLSPLSVRFTDLSTNEPNSWQWSFGDGQTSSEQNPVHTYTAPGIFTVQLTAYNPDGSGTVIKTGYIRVSDGFIVNFTAAPLSGTAPLTVSFMDLSTGSPESWLWNFGDNTTSTEQSPSHTYHSGGSYTVTLNASNGVVSQTEEKTGYINVTETCLSGLYGIYYDEYNSDYSVPFSGDSITRIDPRIWFADSASGEESDEVNWPVGTLGTADHFSVSYEGFLIVPENDTYTFYLRSDDGSVLWIDDIADDDPVLIDNWGLHSPRTESASLFLTRGKHPFRVKMTENSGRAVLHLEWESATIPRQVAESFCYVPGASLSAAFEATPQSGINPLSVQFTDLSVGNITSWEWEFGDGETSSLQNPVHVYSAPGLYNVSLTVEGPLASSTETKEDYISVTGFPLPVAWWRFDEASGATAVDSSGNGNDGTIAGSVDRRAGACGTGLYFDGTSTWVNVPDDETLGFSDSFTFSGWVKPETPESLPGQGQYRYFTQIIGKGYDYYNLYRYSNNYEIFIDARNDRLSFEANGDDDSSSRQGFLSSVYGLPFSYGEWVHLAVVIDGEDGYVYVNGNEEGTFSVERTPLQENNEPVSIGKQIVTGVAWAEFYYRGMMDELILYDTALTSDQVSSLADGCTPASGEAPEVSFSADPVIGDAPLDVQFISSVTGSEPYTYAWNFGDGSTSDETNPEHRYESPGVYSVNLTVSNAYGTDTVLRSDLITVESASEVLDIELITGSGKPGYIESGGIFTFTVDGLYSYVIIDSNRIDLNSGDQVEIRVDDGSEANIYMTSAFISSFTLSDATLLVNNDVKGNGAVSGIWISSYSTFDSTADLTVPKKNKDTRLTVGGTDIINGKDDQVISLFNIQQGSSGTMNLNLQNSEIYFSGGAEGYQVA